MPYLSVLLILLILISFSLGRYGISVPDIINLFYCKLIGAQSNYPPMVESVLFKVRMPRVLMAVLVGGALAVSGATYQRLFRNPMLSPDILGASAGAGFGAGRT